MRATVRIDDALYREAKVEAARQGVTATRFIDEGLRLRLQRRPARPGVVDLPTFDSGRTFAFDPAALKRLMGKSQMEHNSTKIGGG